MENIELELKHQSDIKRNISSFLQILLQLNLCSIFQQ